MAKQKQGNGVGTMVPSGSTPFDDPADVTTQVLALPKSLAVIDPASEAATAFTEAAGEAPPSKPVCPEIVVDHDQGAFVLPGGEIVDGHVGIFGYPIHDFETRQWWAKAYSSKGEHGPPDCSSSDCITPRADSADKQSETCASCEHNKYGSSANGRSKACAQNLTVFIFNPSFGAVPVRCIVFSPTSLVVIKGSESGFSPGYFREMDAAHGRHEIVFTRFLLERENDEDKHVTVKAVAIGAEKDLARCKELGDVFKKYLPLFKAMRSRGVEK